MRQKGWKELKRQWGEAIKKTSRSSSPMLLLARGLPLFETGNHGIPKSIKGIFTSPVSSGTPTTGRVATKGAPQAGQP